MRHALTRIAFAALLALGTPAAAQEASAWLPYADALAAAAAGGRPVLVVVDAPWCGPCRRMEREAFADARVRSLLAARFAATRLRFDDGETTHRVGRTRASERDLARRLGAEGTPTLVVLAPDGTPRARLRGYAGTDAVLALLRLSAR